ncbi:hypothetical protein D9758_004652 [Tetrapyrgos nigripes]|uniref:HAT C-terminal dimerisation domain-containing protein n=1 Tax=Tetrapyrgos nigripes TaxID=182062 RepID=A0A8H5LYL8_9AGAR|nr:hypothetical protein D9758_004652 [Tetrapyrgos nigripes]
MSRCLYHDLAVSGPAGVTFGISPANTTDCKFVILGFKLSSVPLPACMLSDMDNSQCAVNPDGTLKDTSEIQFYNDPADTVPISGPGSGDGNICPSRNKHTKMLKAVQADLTGDEVTTKAKKRKVRKGKKAKKGLDSSEGSDFVDNGESTDISEDPVSDVPNEERAQVLNAKTFPPKQKKPVKKKRRIHKKSAAKTQTPSRAATVEEVEDEEASPCTASLSSAAFGSIKRTNPIYLFFEEVAVNAKGETREKGDKHFHCLHGSHHVLTITKKMNSSLNADHHIAGLRNHLKSNFRNLYNFYEVLKDRNGAITQQEVDITAGRAPLDAQFQAVLDNEIEKRQDSIKEAFARQQAAAKASCMNLGTRRNLRTYSSNGLLRVTSRSLRLRHRSSSISCSMSITLVVLKGKVALSIDTWTSSNQYPFLAVVAHYIADDGVLEECLIDFRELEGAHSGENMAEALLEGIGAILSKTSEKLSARGGNYQDNFNIIPDKSMATDNVEDNETADYDDDEEDLEDLKRDSITPAVTKLRKIVRHVRSSPQRRAAWLREIDEIYAEPDQEKRTYKLLMLILDVITRWGSTHQMMRRGIQFRDAVDSYARSCVELQDFCLSSEEWDTLIMEFRAATVQMSATRTPMLSRTLEIMQDLEHHVRDILANLPWTTPAHIRDALVAAHNKLILDPRVDRDVLEEDYKKDVTLDGHLKKSRNELRTYFETNYLSRPFTVATSSTIPIQDDIVYIDGSPQKKKTSRYHRRVDAPRDELTEFWKQPPQDSEKCDPIQWWQGQKATFPTLYRLALDIFSIPGSAVAVERVFSGGRDTISLRHASLHPDTIRMLMIAKNRLHLARRRRK